MSKTIMTIIAIFCISLLIYGIYLLIYGDDIVLNIIGILNIIINSSSLYKIYTAWKE